MFIDLQQIEAASKRAAELTTQIKQEETNVSKTLRDIEKIYEPQIQELKNKLYEAESEAKLKSEKIVKDLAEKRNKEYETVRILNHVYDLISIHYYTNGGIVDPNFTCRRYVKRDYSTGLNEYEYETYEPIGTLVDDKYKHLKAFITENKKPKNKWSLFVAGNVLFSNMENFVNVRGNLSSLPCLNSYSRFNIYGEHNTKHFVQDGPTKESLLKYWEKHKDSILKDYLTIHTEIEKDYEDAITFYKTSKTLQKKYWKHKMDQCSKDSDYYKQYKDMLTIVECSKDQYPTIMSKITSEEGRHALSRVMRGESI